MINSNSFSARHKSKLFNLPSVLMVAKRRGRRTGISWVGKVAGMPFLVILLGAAPLPPDPTVTYTVAPRLQDGKVIALSVTIDFRATSSGNERLTWPTEWAGEKRLAQWVRNMTISGVESVGPLPEGGRTLRVIRGRSITVRYDVVSAYASAPTGQTTAQPSPVILPDWFNAVGEAVFARPGTDDGRPAVFRWRGPANLGFASDLQHRDGRTDLKGISQSVLIGGRNLHLATSSDQKVTIASVGDYAFDQRIFDETVLKIIEAERHFWRDETSEPYLVAMSPVRHSEGLTNYGGTGRSDAFALWMDDSVGIDAVRTLLAHEYFHTWNPERLGGSRLRPLGPKDYWFSEGLTDFYARRLLLRSGLITSAQFTSIWNDALRQYANSSFRTAKNDTIAGAYWNDEQADRMQYQRGAMLAARWDRQLKARGLHDGLDEVLRLQLRLSRSSASTQSAVGLFKIAAHRYGLDVTRDIGANIINGLPILLGSDTFEPCGRTSTRSTPAFDRGWNVSATEAAGNVVVGLRRSSPAYAAGLRDGMRLVERISGGQDDATVDYVIRVQDGSTDRIVKFTPKSDRNVIVQQIVSTPEDSCTS